MFIRIFVLWLLALGAVGGGCKERASSPPSKYRGASANASASADASASVNANVPAKRRAASAPVPTAPSAWLKIVAHRYRDRIPELWQPHPCHPDVDWFAERELWEEIGLASLPEVGAHWETNAGVIRSNGRAVGVDLTGLTEAQALALVSAQRKSSIRWVRWRNAKTLWPTVLRAVAKGAVHPHKQAPGTAVKGGLFLVLPDFEGTPATLATLAGLTAAGAPLTGLMLSADRLSAAALQALSKIPGLKSLTVARAQLHRLAWREFRRLAHLEHLTLEFLPVSSAGFAHIARIPRLRRLTINGDTVAPTSVIVATLQSAAVVQLVAAKGLRELNLSGFAKTGDISTPISKLRELRVLTLERVQFGDAALARIATLPRLQALAIGAEDMSDRGVAHLSKRPSLRCLDLDLARNPLSNAAVRHITALQQLVTLRLGSRKITSVAPLAGKLPLLEVLHLRSTGIDDDGLRAMSSFPRLRYLNLMGTEISDAGLVWLSKLGGLRALHLASDGVYGHGANHLSGLSQLRVLTLPMGATQLDLAHLRGLTELRQLQVYVPLTTKNAPHLFALKKLQRLILDKVARGSLAQLSWLGQLRTLILPRTAGDDAMRHVGRLHRLRELDLTKAQITDVGLRRLRGLKRLRSLTLDQTEVGDVGLEVLAGMVELRHLSLNDTRVTGASLRYVAALKRLRVLKLSQARLKPTDLRHLVGLPVLTLLHVNCTRIGDPGLRVLSQLPAVRSLSVGGNGITNGGLRFLRKLSHLRSLNIMYNYGISDVGLHHLSACKALRVVTLSCTKVTRRGLKRLHQTRVRAPTGPGCFGGHEQVSSFCQSWHTIKKRRSPWR